MRVTICRIFSLLITNIHHRLLPEGAVRVPLLRLIRMCHELDDLPQQQQIKMELVKLIHAVFRQLKFNPALVNLFIEDQSIGGKHAATSPDQVRDGSSFHLTCSCAFRC